LRPAHRLAGKVVRDDGTPAAGSSIDVVDPTVSMDAVFPPNGAPLGFVNPPGPEFPRLVRYASARVLEDGTFEVVDLPEGPYALRVTSPSDSGVATGTNVATDARD